MKKILTILLLLCVCSFPLAHAQEDTYAVVSYEEDNPDNWGFGFSMYTGCMFPTASLKRVLNVMPAVEFSMDGRYKNLLFGVGVDTGLSKRKRDLNYIKGNETWEKGELQSVQTIETHVGYSIYNSKLLRVTPQAFIGANIMPPDVDTDDEDDNNYGSLAYGPACTIDYKLFGWDLNGDEAAIRLYYQFNIANLDKHYSDSMGNFHKVGIGFCIYF